MQDEIENLYDKIQKLLIKLIPDTWKSICLYASVLEKQNGEMYFYYFPKRLIKANPINCYEIPGKYGIDEESYKKNLQKLYGYIKQLKKIENKKWTNITIVMDNTTFTIEYHYNDLINSKYNDEQRRIVWTYKYLNIPLESLNLKNRLLVEGYKEEGKIKPVIHSEKLKLEEDRENEDKTESKEENVIRNPFLKI